MDAEPSRDRSQESRPSGDEERNLLYWAEALHVTREELRSALEDFGPIITDLKRRTGRQAP